MAKHSYQTFMIFGRVLLNTVSVFILFNQHRNSEAAKILLRYKAWLIGATSPWQEGPCIYIYPCSQGSHLSVMLTGSSPNSTCLWLYQFLEILISAVLVFLYQLMDCLRGGEGRADGTVMVQCIDDGGKVFAHICFQIPVPL